MSALVESIQSILRERNFGIPAVNTLDQPMLHKSYLSVRKKLGEGSPVEPPPEPDFWINLAHKAIEDNSWQNLKRHELRNIGLCLSHGQSPLIENDRFLDRFLSECKNQNRKSLCRALIWAYLFNYTKNNSGLLNLGKWLSSSVNEWDWHWADRQKNLKLLGNDSAPSYIAEAVLKINQNVSEILDSCGIGGNLQSGGMAHAAFEEALTKFSILAKRNEAGQVIAPLQRILEWAILDDSKFSYPRLRDFFVNSLLEPWENNTPEQEVRTQIQSFLIEHFGDPRLGGANWLGVSNSAQRVIRSWLVERALAQFLDVVDELALDHQWKYRRAFWMAYYKRDVISDAWVAFAANGAIKARQIAKRQDDVSWLSFGQLQGQGDSSHAVLILRIGDLTIADFSHNGKCRIWNAHNNHAPKPYEKYYDRSDLMHAKANSEYIHSHSERATWQRNVAGEISSKAGVSLAQKDYMPK